MQKKLKMFLEKVSVTLFLMKLQFAFKYFPAVPALYQPFAALYPLVAKGADDGRKAFANAFSVFRGAHIVPCFHRIMP
jgi:hypothetical protein